MLQNYEDITTLDKALEIIHNQDAIIGSQYRNISNLEDSKSRYDQVLSQRKREAGYDQSVSFDIVWEELMKKINKSEPDCPSIDSLIQHVFTDDETVTPHNYAVIQLFHNKGETIKLLEITNTLPRAAYFRDVFSEKITKNESEIFVVKVMDSSNLIDDELQYLFAKGLLKK